MRKLDGVWISESHITAITPSLQVRTDGDHWKMKFQQFDKDFLGKTEFETESDCDVAIDKIFDFKEEDEDDDRDDSVTDMIIEDMSDLRKRVCKAENHIAELEYAEGSWNAIDTQEDKDEDYE